MAILIGPSFGGDVIISLNVSVEVDNISVEVDNISVEVDNISVEVDNVSVEVDNISGGVDNISVDVGSNRPINGRAVIDSVTVTRYGCEPSRVL